jgi:hypothetical protein
MVPTIAAGALSTKRIVGLRIAAGPAVARLCSVRYDPPVCASGWSPSQATKPPPGQDYSVVPTCCRRVLVKRREPTPRQCVRSESGTRLAFVLRLSR